MKIKENAEQFNTTDFWYDLFTGGYLIFEDYLEGEDLEKILIAKQLLYDFCQQMEDKDLINQL